MPQPVDVRMVGLAAAGAAIGVLARALAVAPAADPVAAAWTTMAINVVGSLALGLVVGWLDNRHPRARMFWGTGVLGGFTTYSAFAVQVASASAVEGVVLVAASLAAGVAGALVGLFLGRRIADVPGEIEPPAEAE